MRPPESQERVAEGKLNLLFDLDLPAWPWRSRTRYARSLTLSLRLLS